jgi:hypothetical protein
VISPFVIPVDIPQREEAAWPATGQALLLLLQLPLVEPSDLRVYSSFVATFSWELGHMQSYSSCFCAEVGFPAPVVFGTQMRALVCG